MAESSEDVTGRLIERSGARAGRVHLLTSAVTTIGRDPDNDIVIPSDHISRHHARITRDEARAQYVIEDLGSKNGTLLNGGRLTAPASLRDGDVIALPGRPPLALAFAADARTVTLRQEAGLRTGVWIDTRAAEVWVDGRKVHVTTKEYLALALLCERADALVTRDELAARVWPEYQGAVSDENIEQLVSRLRHKIEATPEQPRRLITVRGLGYRLLSDADGA